MLIIYQTSTPKTRPQQTATVYFPVNVGDLWTYQNFEKNFKWFIKVVGAKTIDDKKYFVFERSFEKSTYRDTSYYRIEESRVLVHHFGQDYVLVDFDRVPQDTWDSYGVIKGMVLNAGSMVSAPAGAFAKLYEVKFEIQGSAAGSEWLCKYAPGVGLVEYQTAGGTSRLIEASVKGKIFPDVQEMTSFSNEVN